ncbi:hypothetical protein [Phaeobacter inhibens]|uniref:hypothetical protein n=1 Tax=Phaeobacter inhibens TaxID=221822 RepID=UPI0021A614BA|nr:hypothetical protein [Phaeobacter inhibens]UWS06780.1 hypothetical protein K4K98_10980 [Phaeobacter inhibens]
MTDAEQEKAPQVARLPLLPRYKWEVERLHGDLAVIAWAGGVQIHHVRYTLSDSTDHSVSIDDVEGVFLNLVHVLADQGCEPAVAEHCAPLSRSVLSKGAEPALEAKASPFTREEMNDAHQKADEIARKVGRKPGGLRRDTMLMDQLLQELSPRVNHFIIEEIENVIRGYSYDPDASNSLLDAILIITILDVFENRRFLDSTPRSKP